MTDNEIVKEAHKLVRPKFTSLTNSCSWEAIGKPVYVNKTKKVIVDSIVVVNNEIIVKTESGKSYSLDNLWIKKEM